MKGFVYCERSSVWKQLLSTKLHVTEGLTRAAAASVLARSALGEIVSNVCSVQSCRTRLLLDSFFLCIGEAFEVSPTVMTPRNVF